MELVNTCVTLVSCGVGKYLCHTCVVWSWQIPVSHLRRLELAEMYALTVLLIFSWFSSVVIPVIVII